ncbi:monooxygenase FAD-binding protein [Colletotrichum truncatum]|uniref:Monooxygenase FAD-binding protein n=1 Tax=Colletotrichum truncatum TaxID=5467 RepID=A0ACC3YMY8_COLTU|nr:monooxygenase FAD-binding protein [Colletotrichum truncatum]KAF6792162.1 monooxygenase FAD-binding protein [Colletotrichum truncatum]
MTELYDVIIAGAGPVGLLLACELGLAGASVLVLERDAKPESPWKSNPVGMRGLHLPSVELLYRRGLLGKLFDLSKRPHSPPKSSGMQFGGHFAGIPLDLHKLDLDRWKYRLPGPSLMPGPITIDLIESVLSERAESLGVKILRGHGFDKILEETEHDVTVEAGEQHQAFRGRWLVGCDGGRSAIRKAAGFEFVGTEATFTGYVVHCDLDHPDKLAPGFQPTRSGMYIFRKPDAVYLMDFDDGAGRTKELSQERLQDILNRVRGETDVQITKVHLATSFTDRSKQVTAYRRNRILLAGDAAHIHPPLGAQGMNTGLGDAMNLGWKLAASVRREKARGGEVDFALVDTYGKERHPVGEFVLEWNRVQVATLQPNPAGYAVKKLMRDIINTDDGVNHFFDRVWGLSQRYDLGDKTHPLTGQSAPDFTFTDGSRLGPKMEEGRGLLVDFEDDGSLKGLLAGRQWESRVDYLGAEVVDRRGVRAFLVRPDGFVAWAAEENSETDTAALEDALEFWFGF